MDVNVNEWAQPPFPPFPHATSYTGDAAGRIPNTLSPMAVPMAMRGAEVAAPHRVCSSASLAPAAHVAKMANTVEAE